MKNTMVMADFNAAFEKTMLNEGGFKLVNVAGDSGGRTYAGIAENYHPDWEGWQIIDSGDMDNLMLTQLVKDFYKTKFWDKLKGDEVEKQQIAESVFDFGVNAGIRTSVKLSQKVVGVLPDGVVGPKTLKAYNGAEEEEFVLKFALAKVARYAAIVDRDRSQSKFLLGWIKRTLKSIE